MGRFRMPLGARLNRRLIDRRVSAVVLALLCAGCAPAPSGVVVEGQVRAAGQPLHEGLITFEPSGATPGPKVSAVIADGNYFIPASEGLAAGKFRVEVMGIPPGVKAMAEGLPRPRGRGDYREIAAEFNRETRLRCELKSDQDNHADFDVAFEPPAPPRDHGKQ